MVLFTTKVISFIVPMSTIPIPQPVKYTQFINQQAMLGKATYQSSPIANRITPAIISTLLSSISSSYCTFPVFVTFCPQKSDENRSAGMAMHGNLEMPVQIPTVFISIT